MDKLVKTGIQRLYASKLGQTWLNHSKTCQTCAEGDFCTDSLPILDLLAQTRI